MVQDPRQESTIVALQELYDQLRSKARPRRPSGLTITDHVGPHQEARQLVSMRTSLPRAHPWRACQQD